MGGRGLAKLIENNTHRVLYRHTPEGVIPPSVNLHSPVSEFVGVRRCCGTVLPISQNIRDPNTHPEISNTIYKNEIQGSSDTNFKYEVQIRNFKCLRKRYVEGKFKYGVLIGSSNT